jgi:hypothetical protein
MTGGPAILFWFYRDLPVCQNRLALLRRHNPDTPIFGLFGGDPAEAPRFEDALRDQLDDYWAYEVEAPAKWKWRHGDLMLADWYEARGRHLDWDHVFVAQWDLLVLEPLESLLPELAPDEVLLSDVKPVAAHTSRWVWAEGGHKPNYDAFRAEMEEQFGEVEPLSCLFVIACLPRRLLAAYAELPDRETGYVEYRLPTLASAVGLRVVDGRYQRFVNGTKHAIRLPAVLNQLRREDGARFFHPYFGLYPVTPAWAVATPIWGARVGTKRGYNAVMARVKRLAG